MLYNKKLEINALKYHASKGCTDCYFIVHMYFVKNLTFLSYIIIICKIYDNTKNSYKFHREYFENHLMRHYI